MVSIKLVGKDAEMFMEMANIMKAITELKEQLQRGMSADVRQELDWLIRDFNRMEDGMWNELEGIIRRKRADYDTGNKG